MRTRNALISCNIGHLLGLELGSTVWLLASKVLPGRLLLPRDSHGVGDWWPSDKLIGTKMLLHEAS